MRIMPHFKREAIVNLLFPILVFLVPVIIYFGYLKFFNPQRHVHTTEAGLLAIREALFSFKDDIGRFPTKDEGLTILLKNNLGLRNWRGPYISSREMLKDGWNNSFTYGIVDNTIYIGSPGKNKMFDTTLDDIKMKHQRGDDVLLFLDSQ
jgi:hypothetical protein